MHRKAVPGTTVIFLWLRFRYPGSSGQEPCRTSGDPSVSPVKTQPPKVTVQGRPDAPLGAAAKANAMTRRGPAVVLPRSTGIERRPTGVLLQQRKFVG